MALWSIYYQDGRFAGSRNSGETAEQAIAEWNQDNCKPYLGIEYHDELPNRGRVENIRGGKSSYRKLLLCDYFPTREPATKAQRMREVWMDAGYCRVPA